MGFRDVLPPSLQEIVQNGLLEGAFEDALIPSFLYNHLAEDRPWGSGIGTQGIFTKDGLMVPTSTPVTGQDAGVDTYGVEQYSVKMDQFGRSIDTNMAMSAFALASKFLNDNKILGIHAAQSLDLVAQQALYGAYGEGQTYAVGGATATSLVVDSAAGFVNTVVNLATTGSNPAEGMAGNTTPTVVPVSSSNPLAIIIGASTAASVTGVDLATNTLTLAVSKTWSDGDAVVAANAPVMVRAGARASQHAITGSDVLDLALIRSGVTRLRAQHVPTINGAYTLHVSAEGINELFSDTEFQAAYRGRGESAAYVNFTPGDAMGGDAVFHGRFAGVDWIENSVTPTVTNPSNVVIHRPLLSGDGSLIRAPFESMGDLVAQMNTGGTVEIQMIGGVARILRAPLDRFGQVLTSTWSWIGGYAVPTDLLAATNDPAIFKRALVLEHA